MGTYMNSDSTHYKQKLQSLNINELPSKKLQFTWIRIYSLECSKIGRYYYRLLIELTVTQLNDFYWNKKNISWMQFTKIPLNKRYYVITRDTTDCDVLL